MSIDVMKQALAAHKKNESHRTVAETRYWCDQYRLLAEQAITALRAAIEQAQEPVAWVGPSWMNPKTRWQNDAFSSIEIAGWIPLYTAPRQWQGLTEIEFRMLYVNTPDYKTLWEAIEAKLRNKNP